MPDILGMLYKMFLQSRGSWIPPAQETTPATPTPPEQGPGYTPSDVDTLARTAWGEARGEGDQGIQAVLNVIKNRRERAGGDTSYSDIALAPKQFSAWNPGDPNYQKMQSLSSEDLAGIEKMVQDVLTGQSEDPTGGALYYHSVGHEPYWAKGQKPTATIGRHVFYGKL